MVAWLHSAQAGAATRVVALAPPLGELLCALGDCGALVGVSDGEAHVLGDGLATLGEPGALQAEQVLALEPAVALAREGVTERDLARSLRRRGVRVHWLDVARMKAVAPTMQQIGALLGREADGEAAAEAFERRRAELDGTYGVGDAEPLRVFYQVSLDPLRTVDRRLPVSDAIELCGGLNVFPRLGTLEAPVSKQAVLLRQPDVIIVGADDAGKATRDFWQAHPTLPAVKVDGIIDGIDAALMRHAAPRLLDAAEALCRAMDEVRDRIVR